MRTALHSKINQKSGVLNFYFFYEKFILEHYDLYLGVFEPVREIDDGIHSVLEEQYVIDIRIQYRGNLT